MPAEEIEDEDSHSPTTEELVEAVVSNLTYVGKLCAAYLVLGAYETIRRVDEKHRALFRDAIVEISLLFIRKTTEFFSPLKERKDDLHARQYFEPVESYEGIWLIEERYCKILHKAVGHVTVRGARRAVLKKPKDNWPIRKWTLLAIEAWIAFIKRLPQSHVFGGNPPLEEIESQRRSLEELAEICRHSSATD